MNNYATLQALNSDCELNKHACDECEFKKSTAIINH